MAINDFDLELKSEQGIMVYYKAIHPTLPASSTPFPRGRSAFLTEISSGITARFWIILAEKDEVLAIIPSTEILSILKLETVGPTSADQPK